MTTAPPDADEELERLNADAYDEAGVDVTQIDAMLAMSPAERLRTLYETASSLSRMIPDADPDPLL